MSTLRTILLCFLLAGSLCSAQPIVSHSITVSWQPDAVATGGFNIYRGTTSGGPYTNIGSVLAGTNTFTDTTGTGGVQYYYVVTALDTASPPNESRYSNETTAVFLFGLVPAPIGVQAISN